MKLTKEPLEWAPSCRKGIWLNSPTRKKREYIMTKPCMNNVFGSPRSIYEVKIKLSCTGKSIWRILLKKVPKIWNFLLFFFFKWIKHIDLFQTMDKGGKNSCSLWKRFFGPAPYVLSFPKWRKTMEICKNTRFFMTCLRYLDNTRNFIDQTVKFWLINYVQTSSSICNDLINVGFNMALGELGKYQIFSRLSLMKIPELLLNSIFLCFLAHYMKIRWKC